MIEKQTSLKTQSRRDASTVDVAKRARVSLGTVSRVINQYSSVDPELRRRVWTASRELGFVPKQQNRHVALITGRKSPALPVGYVSVMVSLLSQHLTAQNYVAELIDVENLEQAYEAHIQGAIGIVFDERLADLQRIPNLALLAVNHPMVGQGIHSVCTDHYQQARLATEHLLAHGHRRIAFLAIDLAEWGSAERRRGYEDAMASAGFDVEEGLVQSTLVQPVYDVLNRWISRKVTAILNFSEDASLEVLHILSNVLKLRIGIDISTISLEDLPIYQYLTPPQTTIRQPLEELARLAVEKMLELCGPSEDGEPPRSLVNVCLPSMLMERDSVATIK